MASSDILRRFILESLQEIFLEEKNSKEKKKVGRPRSKNVPASVIKSDERAGADTNAKSIGVPLSTYYRWTRGDSSPTVTQALDLQKVTGVTPNQLDHAIDTSEKDD